MTLSMLYNWRDWGIDESGGFGQLGLNSASYIPGCQAVGVFAWHQVIPSTHPRTWYRRIRLRKKWAVFYVSDPGASSNLLFEAEKDHFLGPLTCMCIRDAQSRDWRGLRHCNLAHRDSGNKLGPKRQSIPTWKASKQMIY